MLRRLLLAAGLALALASPVQAADPQKFADEAKATAFCKTGNVVWFNPDSKIYFAPGSQYYGKTKAGGYTCKAFAEKEGFSIAASVKRADQFMVPGLWWLWSVMPHGILASL